MNPIIMQMKVEEQRLKKEITELKIKTARLVNELASYIGTYYGDFENIDAEKIEQIGDELLLVKNQLLEASQKISKIKKELGDG